MEYMFVNKPEFAEPIRVLFLCGAKFNDIDSDKRIVLKKHLEEDSRNKVILLEKYFDFILRKNNDKGLLSYYDADLFNLHNIESFAALVATNIIVIHETLSTAGEIGVFGSNKELRDRIITLVPEKFSVEEEKISNFLRLAFWNSREKLINNQVIRFYPTTKRTMVSDTHSFYETFFSKNELPRAIGTKIDSQLNKHPKSSVAVLGSRINRLEKGTLSVWLSYASIKNYLLAILSILDNRNQLRSCTKLYEIRNILSKEFSNAIKNAYYNANGIMPKSVRIYIDRQPEYNFTDVLNFMIYFWHACNIMTIKCTEGDSIAVSFSKNTSSLWDTYSELVKQVSFSDWGE